MRALLRFLIALSLTLPAMAGGEWRFVLELASETFLANPHDVKLSPDGTRLYVADLGNDRIAVLDVDTLQAVDEFGRDRLDGPHDIDLGPDGRAYVADTHNNRVAIYALADGGARWVGEWSAGIAGPEGVLVHPNGLVYVAGAWSNNVVAYRDGEVVHQLQGLAAPHDLELATDGRIWLADAGNDRVLLLSESLQIVRELSGPAYAFDGVRYLDVWADGTLVAADKYSHSIKFIDRDGRLHAVLGDGRAGRGPGRFRTPEGVDSAGSRVWLADSGNNRVVRYRVERQR